ncbi:MAG: DNA mismatch repair endonuclease MutL [Bacteroidota bacterium]|nr:DNA mismatch repair endonuclease MutL [Bacteroidota bacterium]
MADIIKLLPDSVANQIAAGEVIQRPASAVKELLENAVDAGSSEIKLVIKDAGKTLIQVSDNGCGMSETDARMSLERHATSKIQSAEDLFAIRTMGFRGEALASVAAIAQVEIKTRMQEKELGSLIEIEGTKLKRQETVSCPAGTSILIKNLFFNVPARRKFLKSDSAELRHIIEEFTRVALAYPAISMTLISNKRTLFQLKASNQKQRIVNILGSQYNERLVPVEQATDKLNISGFIGKPQFAKKTRGEQYFFANKRFIKHAYLNHSVDSAFQELLPGDAFPTYFIFLEIDPKLLDVNIHPTKTEVNFQDNQYVYAILRSAIKQSLGKFNVTPSIDFDVEQSFDIRENTGDQEIKNPFRREKSDYNPFESGNKGETFRSASGRDDASANANWEKLYEISRRTEDKQANHPASAGKEPENEDLIWDGSAKFFQLQNKYILTPIKSGMMIINQRNAHYRILYEHFLETLENKNTISQKELFPQNISLSQDDAEILKDIQEDLKLIGFSIKRFGSNTFVVDGTPAGYQNNDVQELIESAIENYKKNLGDINIDKKIILARAMALNMAIKSGTRLAPEEMQNISDKLFRCKVPEKTPDGRFCFYVIPFEEMEKKFASEKPGRE